MIEGLHLAGVEFRSLAEDFDTATLHRQAPALDGARLQRVVAELDQGALGPGQAKARTEGRFPGRQPSLTEQQREYIRVERSKGVSQRELAKRLEVSRWTIQQAAR